MPLNFQPPRDLLSTEDKILDALILSLNDRLRAFPPTDANRSPLLQSLELAAALREKNYMIRVADHFNKTMNEIMNDAFAKIEQMAERILDDQTAEILQNVLKEAERLIRVSEATIPKR